MKKPAKKIPARYISNYEVYMKKAKESEGFDVSGCGGGFLPGGIKEIPQEKWSKYEPMAAKYAVDEYNKEENAEIELIEMVRVNGQAMGGCMLYMTLKARDKQDNDQEKLYRAKVYLHVPDATGNIFRFKFLKEAPGFHRKTPTPTPTPSPSPPSGESSKSKRPKKKQPKGKKAKLCASNRLPFHSFVNFIRGNHPGLADIKYHDLLKMAGERWRSLSREEKVAYLKASGTERDHRTWDI